MTHMNILENPAVSRSRPPMTFLRGFLVVVEFEIKALRYSSGTLLTQAVVNPAVYLLLLGAGIASAIASARGVEDLSGYLAFLVPGVIAVQALNTFHRVMWRAAVDRQWGLSAMKRVYGVSPAAYVPGMLVAPAVLALAQTATIALCAVLLGLRFTPEQLGLFAAGTVLSALFWGCLGLLATYALQKQDRRNTIVNLLFLPLTFAAPTYYALDAMPTYMQVIAAVNPLTYHVQSMRPEDGVTAVSLMISGLLVLSCLIATVWKVARTELLSRGHA